MRQRFIEKNTQQRSFFQRFSSAYCDLSIIKEASQGTWRMMWYLRKPCARVCLRMNNEMKIPATIYAHYDTATRWTSPLLWWGHVTIRDWSEILLTAFSEGSKNLHFAEKGPLLTHLIIHSYRAGQGRLPTKSRGCSGEESVPLMLCPCSCRWRGLSFSFC